MVIFEENVDDWQLLWQKLWIFDNIKFLLEIEIMVKLFFFQNLNLLLKK